MTRAAALTAIEKYFDNGGFVADLGRRVAINATLCRWEGVS